MKKHFIRLLIVFAFAMSIFCCMGMEVNCDGEFQGFNCGIDGCSHECNHKYKKIEETDSTCGQAGYILYECRKCQHKEKEYKNKPDHVLTTTVHRGLCNEGGGNWYEETTCANCDYDKKEYLYSGSTLHLYDEGQLTALDDCGCGGVTYTCLICHKENVRDFDLHSDESPQMQELNDRLAIAEENGSCGIYLKTCELCGRTVTKTWHHEFIETVLVEPTATEYGLAKLTCTKNKNNSKCTVDGDVQYKILPPTGA